MAEKVSYTVARTDEATGILCQCSCANTVTVYYSSGREARDQKSISIREEPVEIRVLEAS
ncbi:hypothetical protein PQJ75_11835 [Rhodoplanes sp. TEM]|uniref:Uncharacterized protein n=1 Tax=Rhodoplanes tepidamans TaxID=200616 RepID=A0ABT5J4E4_RHOTP|nr:MULTISPECIES: hypothetical protein [Rhodoplanes]MDC7784516.1 hypothetical protein [Rhodoplanes tepidamans]MDC7984423.1 hypothetical protein [Rhodoplanes sp. TEM]MDQ0355744.1 hypothetical protein [Rhodoplanes tepidamans]